MVVYIGYMLLMDELTSIFNLDTDEILNDVSNGFNKPYIIYNNTRSKIDQTLNNYHPKKLFNINSHCYKTDTRLQLYYIQNNEVLLGFRINILNDKESNYISLVDTTKILNSIEDEICCQMEHLIKIIDMDTSFKDVVIIVQ